MYAMLCFPGFRKKALTFSYDDGTVHDEKLVNIFDKYSLKGTFNINSGLGGVGRRMPISELCELYGDRHEVAVHGERHLGLMDVGESFAVREIMNDRLALEEAFGRTVCGMAYAYGDYTDATVSIAKSCGIVYSRTCAQTCRFDIPTDWLRMPSTCHHKHPRLSELTDKFLDTTPPRSFFHDEPKLFYVFGHSYEFGDDNNWDLIENFAARVSGREDVWYATNIEIYDYVRAFDSLRFSADGRTVYNPSATDVYLDHFGNKVHIAPAKTVKID